MCAAPDWLRQYFTCWYNQPMHAEADYPHGRSRYNNRGCRCEICVTDRRAYIRAYMKKNRGRYAAKERAYRRSAKARNYGAVYRTNHRDQIAQQSSQYNHSPAGKMASKRAHQRRKQKLYNSHGDATIQQKLARWEYFGGLCYICRNTAGAMDHVKALARGGSLWPANLRPICKSCNSWKNNRTLEELQARGLPPPRAPYLTAPLLAQRMRGQIPLPCPS